MPSYTSIGANDDICQMLVLNSIQRVRIAGFGNRQWFEENISEYLQPPKEEFFDIKYV